MVWLRVSLCSSAVSSSAKAHRGLADRLDHVEHGVALLVAQHVAQQAAEQADVFFQGRVLVGAGEDFRCSRFVHIDHKLSYWGTPSCAMAVGHGLQGGAC
jgi:hypothetical protein